MMKKRSIWLLTFVLAIIVVVPYIILFATDFSKGKSAYQIAVENGFNGTEEEWLISLKGEKGEDQTAIQSLFESAKENGYTGTFDEWFESLKQDIKGEKGENGDTAISYAVNKAITSVVSIYTGFETNVSYYKYSSSLYPYKTNKELVYYTGAGTMFKVDKANKIAYFVTNYHVLYSPIYNISRYDDSDEEVETGIAKAKLASSIKLYFYGMNLTPSKSNMDLAITASFVGGSLTNDIAVVKVTGEDFDTLINNGVTEATLGDSNNLHVGDSVIAIGNPEGEGISATSGIVSVDREVIEMLGADKKTLVKFNVMRIDAAVNGGNSGGGLFDKNGNIVGVVNAKTVATEIEGMNYAIPINLAINVANNIVKNCNGTTSTQALICDLGFTTKVNTSKAIYNTSTQKVDILEEVVINDISSSLQASNVDLKTSDVIKSFTYQNKTYIVNRQYILNDFIYNFTKGSKVILNIERNGVEKSIELTLNATTKVL